MKWFCIYDTKLYLVRFEKKKDFIPSVNSIIIYVA